MTSTTLPTSSSFGGRAKGPKLQTPTIVHYSRRRSSVEIGGTLLESISIIQGGEEDRLIAESENADDHWPQRRRSVHSARIQPNGPLSVQGLSPSGSFRSKASPSPRPSSAFNRGNSFRQAIGVTTTTNTTAAIPSTSNPPPPPLVVTSSSASVSQNQANSFRMQSNENLMSRCGSKQSLLDSVSQKSHRYSTTGTEEKKTPDVSSSNHQHYVSMPHPSRTSGPHATVDMDRRQRNARRKDIQKKLDQWDKRPDRCQWSFVFDPAGRLCYYWSMVVSLAFLYNFWVIIFRFSFSEITFESLVVWFTLDYTMDLIYLLDIIFHFRTGYLEDGVLQTDAIKLRQHYMNSTTFYIDCLCLLPLDFLYLSLGFKSILRIFRLVKVYQFWAFMDRSERHTNYPNLLRFLSLIHYLILAFHWNACLFHLLHYRDGFGTNESESPFAELRYPVEGDSLMTYLMSLYWTILAMTTIGDLPTPSKKSEYVFVIFELLVGLIAFATVLGYIANIVTNVSAARKEFQAKLDGVKTYMRLRRVPTGIQNKVIKWFDYLWLTQKSSDEERAINCLPDKLKGEIAIHVHLDTLKRVEIFQNTEAGFLCELVLRLRPVLFSPGDYICRKGEVGKEMYICARGRLEVVADEGKTILATLKAGSYFGEISILNMGTAGNRRTASVRSVGYSDLFVLSKKDMWDVLKDYPAARVRLEAIAVKRLEKYKKAPLEKAALPRSESTPGLVESSGIVPLEDMWVSPLPLYSPRDSPDSMSKGGTAYRPSTDSPLSEMSSTRSQSTVGGGTRYHLHHNEMTNHHGQNKHHHRPRSRRSSTAGAGAGPLSQNLPPPPITQVIAPTPTLQDYPTSNSSHVTVDGGPGCCSPSVPGGPGPPPPPVPVSSSSSACAFGSSSFHAGVDGGNYMMCRRQNQSQVPYNGGSISSSGSQILSSLTDQNQFPVVAVRRPSHDSQVFHYAAHGSALNQPTFQVPPTIHLSHHSHHPHHHHHHPPSGPPKSTSDAGKSQAPKEELLLEIRRLRERIKVLEGDNANMHMSLSKTQKDVDQRLAEIEMQIGEEDISSGSVSCSLNSGEEEEKNRESFI